jgi:hypothetical protein
MTTREKKIKDWVENKMDGLPMPERKPMTTGERIVAKLKEMPHLSWLLQSSHDIEKLIDAEIKADREADAQKADEAIREKLRLAGYGEMNIDFRDIISATEILDKKEELQREFDEARRKIPRRSLEELERESTKPL